MKYKWENKAKLRQKINCKSLKLKKISNTKIVFLNIEAKNKIIILKDVMGVREKEEGCYRLWFCKIMKVVELFDYIHTYIQCKVLVSCIM